MPEGAIVTGRPVVMFIRKDFLVGEEFHADGAPARREWAMLGELHPNTLRRARANAPGSVKPT
jgi:hypothetical protein